MTSREAIAQLCKCGVSQRNIDVISSGGRVETDATRGIQAWLQTDKTFCLLAGSYGTGKTFAASLAFLKLRIGCWITKNSEFERGSRLPSGLFIRASELQNASRFDFQGREAWSRAEQAELLVIDHVGVEYADKSDIWLNNFDMLIDQRYSEKRRTIITTNADRVHFETKYAGSIMDRIVNDGVIVLCAGESLRKEKQ